MAYGNPIQIPVPDLPGNGAWIDCSGVGAFPEAQLSATSNPADDVTLQTAASSDAVVGKFVQGLGGANPSSNVSQTSGGLTPVTLSIPLAFVRAVRNPSATGGATTTGLVVNIASSNAGSRGPAGAPGAPVQATFKTDGAGNIALEPGAVGIGNVQIQTVNGQKQIVVTFLTAFTTASYSVVANWLNQAVAPSVFNGIGFDAAAPPNTDGRTDATCTFVLLNGGGGVVDPTAGAYTILFACIGGA